MKKLTILLVLSLALFTFCKKKNDTNPTHEKTFTFNGMKVDHDSIAQGNVTNITADVTGSVTYAWSASAGDIFNSGKTILFGASTCCTGNHDITCTVTDSDGNSESKTVHVKVY